MTSTHGQVCREAAAALQGRSIPDRYWSCGQIGDDRIHLIDVDGSWQVGYAERGDVRVILRTSDSIEAVNTFVDEVSRSYESTTGMWPQQGPAHDIPGR